MAAYRGATVGDSFTERMEAVSMTERFEGRVAIVTGGGRGIGRAVSERLAADGAQVVVADIDEEAASGVAASLTASGADALALRVDITDSTSVARMVAQARESYGGVDILVNNAGTLRSTPAADISPDEWRMVVDVLLTGAFLCSQAVRPSMVTRGAGRICNVASMAGRATSTLGGVHYTAAKAGVLGLTRHLAREWARDAITVNAISPGMVDTPMVQNSRDAAELDAIRATIPFGRFADPEECAALIAFIVSDEASYITGANVDIHGGEIIIA